jgi:hypothetical protein
VILYHWGFALDERNDHCLRESYGDAHLVTNNRVNERSVCLSSCVSPIVSYAHSVCSTFVRVGRSFVLYCMCFFLPVDGLGWFEYYLVATILLHHRPRFREPIRDKPINTIPCPGSIAIPPEGLGPWWSWSACAPRLRLVSQPRRKREPGVRKSAR